MAFLLACSLGCSAMQSTVISVYNSNATADLRQRECETTHQNFSLLPQWILPSTCIKSILLAEWHHTHHISFSILIYLNCRTRHTRYMHHIKQSKNMDSSEPLLILKKAQHLTITRPETEALEYVALNFAAFSRKAITLTFKTLLHTFSSTVCGSVNCLY